MTQRANVALRIAPLALVLIFLVVCGAHIGGITHDDARGVHSLATVIVIAVAVALALQAAATRSNALLDGAPTKRWAPVASPVTPGSDPGVLRPLRC